MNVVKVLRTVGTGLTILGGVGAAIGAGFEISDGVSKLKELKDQNSNNDSVAPVAEVEA